MGKVWERVLRLSKGVRTSSRPIPSVPDLSPAFLDLFSFMFSDFWLRELKKGAQDARRQLLLLLTFSRPLSLPSDRPTSVPINTEAPSRTVLESSSRLSMKSRRGFQLLQKVSFSESRSTLWSSKKVVSNPRSVGTSFRD